MDFLASLDRALGYGQKWFCEGNCAVSATDCYEENKLYVENSLPVSMTLTDCFDSCKAVSCCDVSMISSLNTKES